MWLDVLHGTTEGLRVFSRAYAIRRDDELRLLTALKRGNETLDGSLSSNLEYFHE